MRRTVFLLPFFLSSLLWADVSKCACDPARPETMEARECGLCREAEKHPADAPFFFLKDNNPRKPNRWLVLPRKHFSAGHSIDDMPQNDYIAFWMAAIGKAKELWGEQWGVAYNGEGVRTQCHGHIHIGKFLTATETDRGGLMTIDKPAQIPRSNGKGIWIHAAGNKMHVHYGEQICETVLLR
jgi:hypothetical protein